MGHHPIVAGNDSQRAFLEAHLPGIDTIHLEGYNIRYSQMNRILQAGLLIQGPAIIRAINREHQWVMQKSGELQLDGIISDNRYGLHHPTIPSVIITHQLRVMSGIGGVADGMIQRLHYRMLNSFSATWVPDTQSAPNLAGKLSHPAYLPRETSYLGPLSRFATATTNSGSVAPLLILLSGPEPQRTTLAQVLWRQVLACNNPVVFVEGSEHVTPPTDIPPHITYCKRLSGSELQAQLWAADMVVCRSGYSTIMDLVALGKRAIVIPTPGQTEQQYLGRSLHEQGIFYCTAQRNFDLQKALRDAAALPFRLPALQASFQFHKPVVDKWLQTL